MESMTIHWQKCNNYLSWGSWCRLDSDLLDDPRLEIRLGRNLYGFDTRIGITGVYIIWAGIGDNRAILKVGSGIIKDRLRAHLNDPKVQSYEHKGLYATWATLPLSDRSLNPFRPPFKDRMRGAERFLSIILAPVLLGERFPANVEMIAVNPPEWDEPVDPLLRALNRRGNILPNNRNPFSLP